MKIEKISKHSVNTNTVSLEQKMNHQLMECAMNIYSAHSESDILNKYNKKVSGFEDKLNKVAKLKMETEFKLEELKSEIETLKSEVDSNLASIKFKLQGVN